MIKLHEVIDNPECNESFEREVTIEDNWFRVKAYCYGNENDIKVYDTGVVELKKKIIPEKSSYEWRGDGKIILNLRK